MSVQALRHLEQHAPAAAPDSAPFQNHALYFASDAMKSEAARVDARFADDFTSVLAGNCIYLKNFVTRLEDTTVFKGLVDDLHKAAQRRDPKGKATCGSVDDDQNDDDGGDRQKENASKKQQHHQQKKEIVMQTAQTKEEVEDDDIRRGLRSYSKHQIFDDPGEISPVFNAISDFLARYFDIDVYANRLNYYADGNAWKPAHHDSHAYGGRREREDFTAGLTISRPNVTRELCFSHEPTGRKFNIPQKNGDAFAFSNVVNEKFMHGVPRHCAGTQCGPRISIIVWGKRRTINERNGGGNSVPGNFLTLNVPTTMMSGGGCGKNGNKAKRAVTMMQQQRVEIDDSNFLDAAKSLVDASVSQARLPPPCSSSVARDDDDDDDQCGKDNDAGDIKKDKKEDKKPKKKKNRLQ